MIVIIVVSSVAGLELVILVSIAVFCIQRAARKRHSTKQHSTKGHSENSEPRHPQNVGRTSRGSSFRPYLQHGSSQYYATIDDVCEVSQSTTPSITTAPNLSYNQTDIDVHVKMNAAYNQFTSSQEGDLAYNEVHNHIVTSDEGDSGNDDVVTYAQVSTEGSSTTSYEYPSQKVYHSSN